MLVTIRTKRFKNMLSFRFCDIFCILVFSFLSVGVVRKVWCISPWGGGGGGGGGGVVIKLWC